jgi:hypothetical protein
MGLATAGGKRRISTRERNTMHRKLKTLGLALVAVLAMSAVVASAASAANFTATKYPTTFTAESAKGNDTFKTEAGTVECKAHFSGTLSAASEKVLVIPKYTECVAFGLTAEVTVPVGCAFEVATNQSVKITLISGSSCSGLVVHSGTCTTVIKPQGPLNKMDLTNNAATTDITVQATVTGIAYEVTQDGFLCPYNGTGAKTGATYTQHSPVTIAGSNSYHIG